MKYLRTKDGIYKVIEDCGDWYKVEVPSSKWDYDEDNHCYYEDSKIDSIGKKDVIKQADTIEELCDEFVLVRENVSNERMKFYQCLYSRLCDTQFDRKPNDKVYGAIWTTGEHGEPILKSVAKMNEEEKVCLL